MGACVSMKKHEMIQYTDQNNNTYSVSATQISYRAIRPENSSSGTYSGGSDRQKTISKDKFKKITSLAEQLFDDSSSHAVRREMRTAMLNIGPTGKEQKVILYPSAKRTEFEEILKLTLGDLK
jgi:hypothetical protein